jgi:hypothetical protein
MCFIWWRWRLGGFLFIYLAFYGIELTVWNKESHQNDGLRSWLKLWRPSRQEEEWTRSMVGLTYLLLYKSEMKPKRRIYKWLWTQKICRSKEIFCYETDLLENCDYLSKVMKIKYFQCSGRKRCNISVLPLILACEVLNFNSDFMLNSNYIGIILVEIKFSQFYFFIYFAQYIL